MSILFYLYPSCSNFCMHLLNLKAGLARGKKNLKTGLCMCVV
jgi:hypothetical protein